MYFSAAPPLNQLELTDSHHHSTHSIAKTLATLLETIIVTPGLLE